ncbi:polysaccharide lyase family protein [Sphingomonas sp. FW199]|uniref:polysaccharide lyase family protein n=1 Tax=Sphingomonas sp. FW199 TaxID=3400217 RepID=UPI003CEDACD6
MMPFRLTRRTALLGASAMVLAGPAALAQTPGVTVTEDATTFTLSNGIVTAKVSKASGDLISLVYKGIETLYGEEGGHPYGYWSHDVKNATRIETKLTIDPRMNGGTHGEVSVKGISGGKKMGSGPGTAAGGDVEVDIELRYHLGRGEQGVHTYCIFDHPPEYPGWTMAEARFAAKLQPWLDHIHVDALRSGPFPLLKGDKYVYSHVQSENRAYGFSSAAKNIGVFLIVTSPEYLSGGPTKPELGAHGEKPTVLMYWRSSHYTGANVSVKAGEQWTRVVGPLMLYVNEGQTADAMWRDARAKLLQEERQWPYAWVNAPGFVNKAQRGTLTGRLAVVDPLAPSGAGISGRLSVGLAKPDYEVAGPNGNTRTIGWQNEGSWYQFWAHSDDRSGRFTIPDIVPGTYTLHAFADGILGEFTRADVTVRAGEKLDLGRLEWRPVRRGRQLWEIGTPTRSAREFNYGDKFFLTALALQYPGLFPDDVTFRIGQSDPAKDWFFQHTPHNEDPASRYRDFFGYTGNGRATPYRIVFMMPTQGRGRATLRLGICGTGAATTLGFTVNGKETGTLQLPGDGVMTRHQIQARWYEFEHSFSGDLLRAGENMLVITCPSGSLNSGVIYDYLRLEMDEDATFA